ncbi:multidrug transporter subunit MdtD [Klebsiella pneumoniae]
MTDLPASVRWQLWIVAFGFFMQSLDTTIVNTALPSMAKSLGESPLHMHMIIVSYVLTVAVMLPASGWLADRVGVRNIFFTAIVLFTAGSLFCAQASTLDQLVMARVLQGVGGAMMVPVGRLTVMKIVPRDQYMAAMTFVTLPGQVGPLLGPALGGVLVEYASWHWIFLINIPVGIVGAIATLCLMPNYTMQTRRFDLSGFLLLAAGMATLTLALDGQKGLGISPAWLAGLVAVGLCALLLYLWHARGNARALFSLNLFRNRTFSLGLGGSFAGRIGSGMLPFMTPVFLQIGLGFSPFHAGLMMIPMVLGSMGMKRIVVQVVNRFGYRRVLVASTLERNQQMRRDLMADISHELRTPLAVLRGELEAIQDGVRRFTPESIPSLQAEVATLTKLVDDLHQLSMSDEGALAYQKTSLDIITLLEVAAGAFRERFASRQLSIQVSLPEQAMIFGDRDRLMQLFNNLLENSLRYTDSGGSLHITARRSGRMLVIDFADSAPGVSDEQLARLCERFYRAEGSRNRASGGSGLGLAICLNIVAAHGGTLRADHSPFGGVSIKVELPLEHDLPRDI